VTVGPLLVAPVVLAAVGVAVVLAALGVLLVPEVLVVLVLLQLAWQKSDKTVRAGSSSTSCRSIFTSLSTSPAPSLPQPYMPSRRLNRHRARWGQLPPSRRGHAGLTSPSASPDRCADDATTTSPAHFVHPSTGW
jgi:hypothetical protein